MASELFEEKELNKTEKAEAFKHGKATVAFAGIQRCQQKWCHTATCSFQMLSASHPAGFFSFYSA